MAEKPGMEQVYEALVRRAAEARKAAYCPYSGFAVGAALLCGDGTVYPGCNIENAALSPGNCAERTAFFRAVGDGKRDFLAIAVVGGAAGKEPTELCPPCGVCRQVMREFCKPGFTVLLSDGKKIQRYTLAELLPLSFGPEQLRESGDHHESL